MLCRNLNTTKGFLKAIDTINKLNPNFVLSGGDNVKDASGQSWERSDSFEYELRLKFYFTTTYSIIISLYIKTLQSGKLK